MNYLAVRLFHIEAGTGRNSDLGEIQHLKLKIEISLGDLGEIQNLKLRMEISLGDLGERHNTDFQTNICWHFPGMGSRNNFTDG